MPVPRVAIHRGCFLHFSVSKNHMEMSYKVDTQVPVPELLRRPQGQAQETAF